MQIFIIIALIALAGVGASLYLKPAAEPTQKPAAVETVPAPAAQNAGEGNTAPTTNTATPAQTGTNASVETHAYKDGTYTKEGMYTSPAGTEKVTVSVTLASDVVTAATFTGAATNPGSVKNQEKFSAGYTAAVVGKKIDDIALNVVNGSSLTPIGFMDALADIKTEAKMQ